MSMRKLRWSLAITAVVVEVGLVGWRIARRRRAVTRD
jgi:hypothetical protein